MINYPSPFTLHLSPFTFLVSQYLQHTLVRLFLAEELGGVLAAFVTVDNNVLRAGLQAVLQSAVAAHGVLIGAGVEKAYVLRRFIVVVQAGKENGILAGIGIVIILTVAG